jgi:hypothetical protein
MFHVCRPLITKDFFMAKDFCTYATRNLHQEKILRDHGTGIDRDGVADVGLSVSPEPATPASARKEATGPEAPALA